MGGIRWVFGAALPAELPGPGGQFFLRGYETDEVVGRGRVFGVVEHRYTPIADLAWNFCIRDSLNDGPRALFRSKRTSPARIARQRRSSRNRNCVKQNPPADFLFCAAIGVPRSAICEGHWGPDDAPATTNGGRVVIPEK